MYVGMSQSILTIGAFLLTGVIWHSVRTDHCYKRQEVEPEADISRSEHLIEQVEDLVTAGAIAELESDVSWDLFILWHLFIFTILFSFSFFFLLFSFLR